MLDSTSVVQHLRPTDAGVGYSEIRPAFHSLPLAPAFIFGAFPSELTKSYFSNVTALPFGCYRLTDSAMTSHGLLVRHGAPVTCDQLNLNRASIDECRQCGDLQLGDVTRMLDGTFVSLVGPGHLIYGHWLVDFLPKLYVLAMSGIDPFAVRYLLPDNTPAFATAWLAMLGIRDEQLVHYNPYQELVGADCFIVPTLLRTNSRAHPACGDAANYLLALIKRIHDLLPIAEGDGRIFVSRDASEPDKRRLTNRYEIERMATAAGFAIVYPERLPLLDQVALFVHARQIVGEYGSGLHGSIFSSADAVVCALRGTTDHPGFLQSGLCQVRGQRVGYVFGATAPDAPELEFTVSEDDFGSALRALSICDTTRSTMQ